MKMTIKAILVLVVLAVVITTVRANCQLALTTWWRKDCSGGSGCYDGWVQDGCNKLGDKYVHVSCASETVLVHSLPGCGDMAIGTLLDEECMNAPSEIPLSFQARWGDTCSASALFKWTDYLF